MYPDTVLSPQAMTCFWQHYLPRTVLPQTRYFLSGVISSLFILAVPTSRRTDLGLCKLLFP